MKRILTISFLCFWLVFSTGLLAADAPSPEGVWKLTYKWKYGSEKSITITFKKDNTFETSTKKKGTWDWNEENEIYWTYDSGTKFMGTYEPSDKSWKGKMKSGVNNSTGTWHMNKDW
jgi:hypothetical protein